jgi:transposase-like zinc-binding protein/putative transposase
LTLLGWCRNVRIEPRHVVIAEGNLPSYAAGLKEPLRQILIATRHIWDVPSSRESVRKIFRKVIDCRTAALGGEIYASDNETLIVPNTCKSRSCSSCGHRASLLWQRDRWCDLLDVPYSMVTLTMPDVLWTIFRANRHLLGGLPSIGAQVISHWVHLRYGATLDIDVIQHTFGRHLNFNCHLHVLVSGFGLRKLENPFVPLRLDADEIMRRWRDAVTLYLQKVAELGQLQSALSTDALRAGLISRTTQMECAHRTLQIEGTAIALCRPLCPPPPNRATSIPDGHGRTRGILDKRPEIEASRKNPISDKRLCRNASRSHSRSLPTFGPQLRPARATIYRADAKRVISVSRTKPA